ncbi:GAF domain-containing protein [candidate division KSB3 bacterium]|uniref:GAF domain-containing protein n=1 Tax=candidate division KSB3 bacterium TaxID=2044937 RepID=A0A9D5JXH6_9BACT|nr:GAF domain-containing protein [candidate division KSB3 bacterium]MBD3326117.1 GAF domain-containing protein [candidate division KSB3 bacterium]
MSHAVREMQEIDILYEISMILSSAFTFNEFIYKTFEILEQKMGMTRGTLRLFNPLTHEITIEIAHGISEEAKRRGKYRLGEGVTGKVIEEGEPVIVPHVDKEPAFLNKTRSRGDISRKNISFICVPIKVGTESMGAITIDRAFSEEHDFSKDVRLLTIVAAMIAQSVKLKRIMDDEEQLLTENIKLRDELKEKYNIHNMIGNSSSMHLVYENIIQVAHANATVMIRGESGTGKELVAHAIHYNSPRAQKPFVKINCGAIPENLLEAELFGYEKGAFTGATDRKKGKLELADGGTIFLDEIGELPLSLQVKLLRVLQEKEFERVGGVKTIRLNVRIIAATNRNLEEEITKNRFREDLYYRLNVFPIYIPPLRERKTDILLLAEYFLAKYARENNKQIVRLSTLAIDLLNSYHWPGNVREVQNCMERAVLICDGDTIQSTHLPPTLQRIDTVDTKENVSLAQQVENFEKELIIDALKKTRGIKAKAARYLSTTERILGYKMKQYNIQYKKFRR